MNPVDMFITLFITLYYFISTRKECFMLLDNFIFSINSVLPIFSIIIIGYLLKNIFDDKTVLKLNKFTFNYALPSMLFIEVSSSNFNEAFDLYLIIYSIISVILIFLTSWIIAIVFKINKSSISSFVQGIYRGSFAIFGAFLVSSIVGDANTHKASLILIFIVPLYNILAIIIFTVYSTTTSNMYGIIKENFFAIVKNPLIRGVTLGIPFSVFDFNLPTVLFETINTIGSIATPIALIGIGATISLESIRDTLKLSLVASILKLVVFTFLFTGIGILLNFDLESTVILFVLFGSPSTVSGYVMAYNMNGNHELAANIIIFTTLLSVFTILLGVFILKSIFTF